jgi:quercetin dioxygenase-like cupin family protein
MASFVFTHGGSYPQEVSMSPVDRPSSGTLLTPGGGRHRDLYAGRSFLFRLTGDDTGDAVGALEERIPPGGGARRHIHTTSEELIYVLEGEFTFLVGDALASGGPGTLAFVPRGETHAWRNCGTEPGRLLVLFLPAGYECIIEAICDTPSEARTPALADRLSQPHGTFNVGPPLTEADR